MLLATGKWPVGFDCYLIRYVKGSFIPPHVDAVPEGQRHFRLNIILKKSEKGGELCLLGTPLFKLFYPRIVLFRPDLDMHCVTRVEKGSRYVLSIGWVLGERHAK